MVTHRDGYWYFSYCVCESETCLEGKFAECKRFKDHLVKDRYVSTQSQRTQSQVAQSQQSIMSSLTKAGSSIIQGAKEKIQSRKTPDDKVQEETSVALYQAEPVILKADYDNEFVLSENESDLEENDEIIHGLELEMSCPFSNDNQQSVCDDVQVEPELKKFTKDKKGYCHYDVVKPYVEVMRLSPNYENTTVLLSQWDLDNIQAKTNDFNCTLTKRHQEIMQNPEFQKLTALPPKSKVQIVLVLYGHPNMKLQHTLNHARINAIYKSQSNPNGIERPKRESIGHFMNGLKIKYSLSSTDFT